MYEQERAWSDQFNDEIRRIIGAQLMQVASSDEDMQHNTDFFVVNCAGKRVASRMRRLSKFGFSDDFTIRTKRTPDAAKTEWDKLIEGWGDWLFYGFGECDGGHPVIRHYRIADLEVLRREFGKRPAVFRNIQHNPDGRTSFRYIRWGDMPFDFIVATSSGWPTPHEVAKAQMAKFNESWNRHPVKTQPPDPQMRLLF